MILQASREPGCTVAQILESIEISRPPEEVFSYMTDPSHFTEWQESLVSSRLEGGGTPTVGSRVTQTRWIGRGERTITMEVTEHSPPTSFGFRGIDGPIRRLAGVPSRRLTMARVCT
jgi:Polyketide cyclase / dehydrase and lipid transport